MADFWGQFQPAPTPGQTSGLLRQSQMTPDEQWAAGMAKLSPEEQAQWAALSPEQQAQYRAENTDPNRAYSASSATTMPTGARASRPIATGRGPDSSTRSPGEVNAAGHPVITTGTPFSPQAPEPTSSIQPPGANGGLPPGYSIGEYTGGGQYPLSSVMGEGLARPWTTPFEAPTDITQQNDPGWQARMRLGTDAIERAAASRGTLNTGATLKDLMTYGQDYASNEYDKIYSRALGQYNTAYNIYTGNQNRLNNGLGNIAGLGQNAANQTGNSASSYANSASNLITDIGNVNASGVIGKANARQATIGDVTNWGMDYGADLVAQPPRRPR